MYNDQQPARSASQVGGLLARSARNCMVGLLVTLAAVGCVPLPPVADVSDNAPVASSETEIECPPEKVTVTDLSWFQDAEGAWHVAGWINNQWDQPVSKIVTDAEALDAAGEVIDHGEDISAYPLNLQPGERAPYIAWIKRDFPGAERFEVEVGECIVAETQERGAVEVRKDGLSFDNAGRAHITGELFNPGTRPVLVNGLAAVLLDAAGNPVAAEEAAVSSRYLAPREHGPLRVTLPLPPDGASATRDYRLYMDAVITEPTPPVIDITRDLRLTRRYLDSDGRFHLVGEVTNSGDSNLVLRLQATLYDDQDRTNVVDAAYLDTASPLQPGETRGFDFSDWGAVNAQPELVHQLLERNAAADVRAEPLQSWRDAASP